MSLLSQRLREHQRAPVDPIGYLSKPLPPVVDGVECRDVCQESLSCADVTGRLTSTNVLLSGLETEAVRGNTIPVPGSGL